MTKPFAALAVLGALALALTACGTTDVAASADTDTPVSTSAGCADDATTTSTDPVELTDAFGRTVSLDQPAQKVAVLEWQQIEDVLSLCLTPVAVADADGYRTWDTAEETTRSSPSWRSTACRCWRRWARTPRTRSGRCSTPST
jgi:iron complex transport system substrate-binding protein